MSGELANDEAIREAMAQEVLNEISASQRPYQTTSTPQDVMREPWCGLFRAKKKPALALSAGGEA